MTILRAAYDVCKYVMQLPNRPLLADLMHRINFSTDKDSAKDSFGGLGQSGRKARRQFAGYLAAAHRLQQSWGPALGSRFHGFLSSDELSLLEEAHQFLLDLNVAILDNVTHKLPQLLNSINPYSQYKWLPQQSGERLYDINIAPIQVLCDEFGQHPALKVIMATPPAIKALSTGDHREIESQLEDIIAEISAVGCSEAPRDLEALGRMARNDPHGYEWYRVLASLVTLKSSVLNLDQLIYQAFQYDRLPVLDDTNAFDIFWGTHAVGHYTTVLAVPTESTFHLEPGHLVLVKIPAEHDDIDGLHSIGSSRLTFSQDTGYECEYQMRRVDENLNCYEALGRGIYAETSAEF